MFGNGDATFQAPKLYSGGSRGPHFIASGDLNLDGHLDIVSVPNEHVNYALVYLNNGSGVFSNPGSLSAT
jgi:hypothetical protein